MLKNNFGDGKKEVKWRQGVLMWLLVLALFFVEASISANELIFHTVCKGLFVPLNRTVVFSIFL